MSHSFIDIKGLSKQFFLERRRKTAFSFLKGLTSSVPEESRFRKYWALENINLRIETGQKIGLIGNNGSGKTTLLKIIAGLYVPTTGIVETRGDIRFFASLGLGMSAEFTVSENIYLYGAICGLSRNYIRHKFHEIVAFAELGEFVNAKVKTLSSGMIQRLAFSIATHVRSDILLLDEVLTVGDKDFTEKCLKIFESYKKLDMIMLIASHNLDFITTFCDKVLWLDKGAEMSFGPSAEVIDRYKFYKSK